MLKRLSTRPPPAPAVSHPTAPRRVVARTIYLGLVTCLIVALANHLFGRLIFFHADGLVLQDRTTIAATYSARVAAVEVREGQRVSRDQVLLRLESLDLLGRVADLSAQRAEQAVRMAELRTRSAVVEGLLPLAIVHEQRTGKVLRDLDGLIGAQLVTAARYEEALRDQFDAREMLMRLMSEQASLSGQSAEVEAALSRASNALFDLEAHYASGIVRAPISGTVGARIPTAGEGVQPADTILTLYSGENYVLAYLPQHYLLPINEGLEVTVQGGRTTVRGIITEVLPVTDALPAEFQSTFKPRDRSRLAKIRLLGRDTFAINETVSITRTDVFSVALAWR